MDSTNHFPSSQTFTDLLFNQQDSYSQPQPQPMSPPNQTESSISREVRVRWSLPKENTLASAWLNTSKDSIVANEQRSGAFWNRVAAYYAASPAVSKLAIRDVNTCKQKWQKMNEQVMKFAGCYETAQRIPRSGETDDDVLVLAYKLYFQDQKAKFTLDHVWRILKNDQKWCSFYTSKSKPKKKKTKLNDGGANSCSSNTTSQEEDASQRPIGVKTAKALAKKRGKGKNQDCEASSVHELQTGWAIKKEDNIVKERLSKEKLLDSLIARSESLSNIEVTLKNKLINEMLSGSNAAV